MALDSNCSIKSPPPFDPDAFGSTTSAVGHSGADLIQASGATFTADVCAGSPHSTELDVVDMHAQRLALEVVSDEDACSSINILLSQTPQRVDAQPRTSRTL